MTSAPTAPARLERAGDRPRLPGLVAGAVVVVASAAVLVVEVLAGRLLAPYLGVTLETYTFVIAVVLAGIAAGTRWGGRLADRVHPARLLGPLVVAGGALTLLVLPLVRVTGAAGPAVLLSLAGFLLPAAALSAVLPAVIKLRLRDLAVTGSVVGRLSGFSTAGALLGTFATGFVLVTSVPSRAVLLLLGVGLVAVGGALWWWLSRRDRPTLTWLLAASAVGAGLTAVVPGPCQAESAYFCARVDADPRRPSGRVLVLDNLRHSYVDLDDPTHLEFGYTQAFGEVIDALFPAGRPLRALHVGGGGFTMPRWLAATRPGSDSLVLELDPVVVELARAELGLRTGPALGVETGDARLAVSELPTGAYDVVVGDAFGGLAVPWHLTTRELVAELHRVLRPGGVYVVNVIDNPPLRFARAEAATLAAVFDHVAVVAPPGRVAGRSGGNVVLVGSDGALVPLGSALPSGHHVTTGDELARFVGDAQVLTDDFAPVDQLLTPAR